MRGTRLFWKLYPSYLFITILSLFVAGWFVSGTLRDFHVGQVYTDLEAKARLISHHLQADSLILADPDQADTYSKAMGKLISTRITVILPTGKVIGDSHKDPARMDNHADRPEVRKALEGRAGTSIRYSHTLRTDMMYVAVPVRTTAGTVAIVRTAMPLSTINGALKNIRMKMLAGSAVAALLAGILCFIISRRISKPLEKLTRGVQHFSREDTGRRPLLPRSASREFHLLEDAMNRMAVELDKRLETVVKQRNELEAILSSMSEGVIAVDQDRRLVIVNESAAMLFETDPQTACGRTIEEAVRNAALQELVNKVLASGDSIEKEIITHSGHKAVLQAHGVPLRSTREGGMIGALVVLTDVTRLQQVENVRKDFVANVSHELKTPITAIKGFAETLIDGTIHDDGDISRFLHIIAAHADRLEKIIEDLLMLSRLEQNAEKETIEFDKVQLAKVVHEATEACAPNAEHKDIGIETNVPGDISITASPHLLEQALVNLVDNAIKYSDTGSSVYVIGEETDDHIVIKVKDEGRGIGKEHLPRIFERFYRVDKARSRKLGGTGLGLAIVKHVAQMHGGRVEVESTPGKGSTFSIYIPRAS